MGTTILHIDNRDLYKPINDYLKGLTVRFFHFAFVVLLYDIWLLTDLLVEKALVYAQRSRD